MEKAKAEAAKKAEELKKQQEEKAKEEAKKVQDNINDAKEKIKAAAEEKKQQLIKQREEIKKKTNTTTGDTTGQKVNYTPDSYDGNSSKRRQQNVMIPVDEDLIKMCVQCCCLCEIF